MLVNAGWTLGIFCMIQWEFEKMDYLNSQYVQGSTELLQLFLMLKLSAKFKS